VARDAGADEVKRAYRSAALRLHPDKNGGDADAAAAFQRVGFAYSVLSDAKKKRYYDETGAAGQGASCVRGTARARALSSVSQLHLLARATAPACRAAVEQAASLCTCVPCARTHATRTGDTEEIDVSAADFMTTFQDLMAEMLGGLSIQARAPRGDVTDVKLRACAARVLTRLARANAHTHTHTHTGDAGGSQPQRRAQHAAISLPGAPVPAGHLPCGACTWLLACSVQATEDARRCPGARAVLLCLL
jgi:curved DNA-binding protein CbpA